MPFNIAGDWIAEPSPKQRHPIKVIKEKRRSSFVTLILNLPLEDAQLKKTCSSLKQMLGCGGSVKDRHIELQGDQVESVKAYLKKMNIK